MRVKSQSTGHGREESLATEQRLDSASGFAEENDSFLFYRELMETNRPPPGIGATNRDWRKGAE